MYQFSPRVLPVSSHVSLKANSLGIWRAEVLTLALGGGCHNEAHDESIEAKRFCEDENQDHAHEQARLLRIRTHTRITDDSDCKACTEGTHADSESGAKVSVA